MKTIRSKQQLEEEKRRLRQRQLDLENRIKQDWTELKDTLRPANLAREAVDNLINRKMDQAERDGGLLKSTLVYGVTSLAQKLMEKASERFGKKSGAGPDE